MPVLAATVGNIVRYNDALAVKRHRACVALVLALWVGVVGAQWAWSAAGDATAHGSHATVDGAHGEFAVPLDHPHLEDSSAPVLPDTFAEAVLSRAAFPLVAIGLAAVLAGAAMASWPGVWAAVRGPPRPHPWIVPGQQLLIRLCIARC
ncbi:hypothetical protein EXE63_01550 (plasmid) [Mycolicibacterium frederiksbergense]|uniref:Lipoprotein LpqS n=1 Tax=Mycolicibacterium frederiksbergense TaxID=117567 RepID=A0A6H0RX80_9MYCO|nr:hypothetical protein EXE63_01550 [Mycolicibacterium frederiksbergense]